MFGCAVVGRGLLVIASVNKQCAMLFAIEG
jgi:hypothetical protein